MVFSNLQEHEKSAFFALLDEYFSSRPDILANTSGPAHSDVNAAAATAVHRAISSNPEAAARVMSAGLRHVANSRSGVAGSSAGGNNPASDNEVSNVAGRVAAASLAFRNNNSTGPSSSSGPPPVAEKASLLSSSKKFGDVDTSSAKGFMNSLRTANKPASPPQINTPPAFAAKQNSFAPPPLRRVGGAAKSPTPEPAPSPVPPPPANRYQQEEEEGEWVEALYEYDSGEAGDLKITEGQRILLTERTSDDWWTGALNGKKGLFPASYVKVL